MDEAVGHQPVDLVPGRGDLRGDGLPQGVGDSPHQVMIDDLVLIGTDAEGRVLVRDPGEQVLRRLLRDFQQFGGERRHRTGQRQLLLPARLVPPVEGAVQEFGMSAEHVFVEAVGDLTDALGDHRERRRDDLPRFP